MGMAATNVKSGRKRDRAQTYSGGSRSRDQVIGFAKFWHVATFRQKDNEHKMLIFLMTQSGTPVALWKSYRNSEDRLFIVEGAEWNLLHKRRYTQP